MLIRKKNNRENASFKLSILPAFLLLALCLVFGCSDEKGPTVPTSADAPLEVTIERDQEIRIGMLTICPSPNLFFSITRGMFDIQLGAETTSSFTGFAGQTWQVTATESKTLQLTDQGGKKNSIPQESVTFRPSGDAVQDGHILIGDSKKSMRSYRGRFEVVIENDKLLAVNIVPMPEYLLGVVPAEMPPSWPEDALKAQAVASRSYAYYNLGRFDYRGFDLADTVVSQAYSGVFAENEATTKAVVDTGGEVLVYEGNLANCLYSSTCGGTSASAAEIFGLNHDVPYLTSTEDMAPWEDYYCRESPLFSWERSYAREDLADVLRKSVYTDPGKALSSLTITSRTPSDWVETIFISGQRDHIVEASDFRATLNMYINSTAMPSTNFELDFIDGIYHITGKGFGHGVGLCQWGAKGRAENGIHYDNILRHYYPGCEIVEISRAKGLTFYRNEDFFLMHKRPRKKNEIEGLGEDYLPPEEIDVEDEPESTGESTEPELPDELIQSE